MSTHEGNRADREPYHPSEYPERLKMAHMLSAMLLDMPLSEMLSQAERADTLGAIIDPTAYRDKMDALHQDIQLLRALANAAETIRKARERALERARPAAPSVSSAVNLSPGGAQ